MRLTVQLFTAQVHCVLVKKAEATKSPPVVWGLPLSRAGGSFPNQQQGAEWPPPLPHSANSSACLHPISALSSHHLRVTAEQGPLGAPALPTGRRPATSAAVELEQSRALPEKNLHLSSPPPQPPGFSAEAKTGNKRAIKSREDVLVRTFD